MKSFLTLVFSLLLVSSCVEREVESYDDLTAAEQEEIRERGYRLCLARSAPSFESFKSQSNEVFLSEGYNRGQGFKAEFSGGAVSKILEVRVWKRTSSDLYFYISPEDGEGYFLKLTKAENIAMIDALKESYCKRPEIYTSTLDGSSLTMTSEYNLSNPPNTEKYRDTYRMPFTSLAAFAKYRLSRTRGTFNADDDQIDTTVKYESKMTGKEYTFNSNAYTDSEYNQKFCTIDSPADYRFPKERGQEGFKYICTVGAIPGGWTL